LKDEFLGRRIITFMVRREIKFQTDFPTLGTIRFYNFTPDQFDKVHDFMAKVMRVQTAGFDSGVNVMDQVGGKAVTKVKVDGVDSEIAAWLKAI